MYSRIFRNVLRTNFITGCFQNFQNLFFDPDNYLAGDIQWFPIDMEPGFICLYNYLLVSFNMSDIFGLIYSFCEEPDNKKRAQYFRERFNQYNINYSVIWPCFRCNESIIPELSCVCNCQNK